jgi:hypothetical protein
LEYAATVWDPYTKFNINKLEKCQRRAARFVIGDYSRESSVTSMLKELKWPTLQQRRTNTKVVMMYRIVHHLIAIPSQMYLTPATTRTTRGHGQKFQIPFSRIECHQNSYFPSAIRTWNNLPAVLISVPTLEAASVQGGAGSCVNIHIIVLAVNITFLFLITCLLVGECTYHKFDNTEDH